MASDIPVPPLPPLPNEILWHIFSYLPLEDRKNVKLTCHLWYRCAINPSIIKGEKLVFRDADNFEFEPEAMIEFLIGLNYSRLNLEFEDVLLSRIPAYIWEICGPNINSLIFRFAKYCWDFDTLLNIIEHSVNLAELEMRIYFDRSAPNSESSTISVLVKLLDELVERGVVHCNLHSFVWVLYRCEFITDNVLHNLFSIFPCIKHFRLDVLNKYSSSLKLNHGLSLSSPLESIAWNVFTDVEWFGKSIMKPEWASRLTKFETYCKIPDNKLASEILFEFFKFHINLTTIKLNIMTLPNGDYFKNLIFCILERCSCLKDLQFKLNDGRELALNEEDMSTFLVLVSKLNCLSLLNLCFRLPPSSFDRILALLPSKDFAMNKLELNHVHGLLYPEFYLIIFQCCPRLEFLELDVRDDSKLQNIFKFLINLKTLIMRIPIETAWVSDYGFCGGEIEGHSIRRLQELECLKIGDFRDANSYLRREPNAKLTARTLHELHFPKLKTLELDLRLFPGKISEADLISLTSRVPKVKTFGIIGVERLDDGVKFCSYFERLTHLSIDVYTDRANALGFSAEDLFEMFPRLRFITYSNGSFHINRVAKRISHRVEKLHR